jgi:hypothetical protein
MGPLIGPGCGNLYRPPCPSCTTSFPQGRGRRAGFVPRPGFACGPSCSDAQQASESIAQRFTGPVPPCRCRADSEVQSTRADRVRAVVGRGPASIDAACLVGGAAVGVTGPGRPKGRGVVAESVRVSRSTPVPWTKPLRGDQGEIRRREARVQREVKTPDANPGPPRGVLLSPGLSSRDRRGSPGGRRRVLTRPGSVLVVDGPVGPLWPAGARA